MNFDEIAFNAVKKWRSGSYLNQAQEEAAIQVLIKDAMCLAIDEAIKIAKEGHNYTPTSTAHNIAKRIKELKE